MNETLILRLIAGITIAVSVGWFVAVVLWPLWQPNFRPPIEITGVMTTVITALFGLYLKAKNPKNGETPKRGGDEDD
ncbi:hypothetical protein OG874_00605 [Nocardia sp. NBC_00565]|uniref:hypothetical protein n=1 Tax=Nocardia sp. NBC_00565 TaxID=2975993 RepID=UPI002E8126ED|nr:hypothetical protein [Nocardia sp. NBC_00565]WUC03756.1 hypothetical protein OG874_00605 [Nocardia sp. NBC_00565]